MRYLYISAFLFLLTSFESKAQDYIVTLADEIVFGKISYATGNKVTFKPDTAKKSVSYLPLQIKGYFFKGVFYASKFFTQVEKNVFTPSFREGDDPDIFQKVTRLEVKAFGKINFYQGSVQGLRNGMNGQSEVRALEIRDNLFYTQIISKLLLAEAVSDYTDLYNRVLTINGNPKVDEIEQVVREYNIWYMLKHTAK